MFLAEFAVRRLAGTHPRRINKSTTLLHAFMFLSHGIVLRYSADIEWSMVEQRQLL